MPATNQSAVSTLIREVLAGQGDGHDGAAGQIGSEKPF